MTYFTLSIQEPNFKCNVAAWHDTHHTKTFAQQRDNQQKEKRDAKNLCISSKHSTRNAFSLIILSSRPNSSNTKRNQQPTALTCELPYTHIHTRMSTILRVYIQQISQPPHPSSFPFLSTIPQTITSRSTPQFEVRKYPEM